MSDPQYDELITVVDKLFEAQIPDSAFTEDYYDKATMEFIRLTASSVYAEKHKWHLIRIGLRVLINERRSFARRLLKGKPWSKIGPEERATRRQRNLANRVSPDEKERRRLRAEMDRAIWRERGVDPDNLSSIVQWKLNNAAEEGAARLLADWVIDGRLKLGDMTGAQLHRLAAKERAIAAGHSKNADFYEALSARIGPDDKLRDHLPAAQIMQIHKEVFGFPEAA